MDQYTSTVNNGVGIVRDGVGINNFSRPPFGVVNPNLATSGPTTDNSRITETADVRITESGDIRITE